MGSTVSPEPRLSDLEAPTLDLASEKAPETMLRMLRLQNRALDRLRFALVAEETKVSQDFIVSR